MYQNSTCISHWDQSIDVVLSFSFTFFISYLLSLPKWNSMSFMFLPLVGEKKRSLKASCSSPPNREMTKNPTGQRNQRRTQYSLWLQFPSTRIRRNLLKLAPLKASNRSHFDYHVCGTWVIWGLPVNSWVQKTNMVTSTSHYSAESKVQYKMVHLELHPGC